MIGRWMGAVSVFNLKGMAKKIAHGNCTVYCFWRYSFC